MGDIHGTPPGWRIESFNMAKNGQVTLELRYPWVADVESSNGALTIPKAPSAPPVSGFTFGGSTLKRKPAGGWEFAYQYEAVQDPQGGTPNEDEQGVEWAYQGSEYQRDIGTHPDWLAIKEKYQWDDVRKEFPDTLGYSNPYYLGGTTSQQISLKSPMYRNEYYDDAVGVLTKTYLTRRITAKVFAHWNRIIVQPWSGMPSLEKGRNFKGGKPDYSPFSDWFKVVQKYHESGDGGWNPDIYGKALAK